MPHGDLKPDLKPDPKPGNSAPVKKGSAGPGQAGLYVGAGLQYAVTVVIGTAGGWWLDEKLSTSPLLLIVGMLFGATAAFYHLYKTLTHVDPADDVGGSLTPERLTQKRLTPKQGENEVDGE